jgi:pyruvate/2-oxoglutarate dehydrogenase complex dihydrolipoamide dehydrogenase (E3) component
VQQAERRLRGGGVEVKLDTEVDEARLAWSGADAVVLATGARFERLEVAADATGVRVLTPPDLFAETEAAVGDVVVDGAGAIGLGVTAWLVDRGARVTVVSADPQIDDPDGQAGLVERLTASGRVTLAADRELAAVGDQEVTLVRSGSIGPLFAETVADVSAVVCAGRREPERELSTLARPVLSGVEIHVIGDSRAPRTALEAVYEGAAVARRI